MMTRSSSQAVLESVQPVIRRLAAPLRQQVVDELRQSIINGRIAPGARLVERELIALTGVSRTVIREALRQLESEGLVAMVPNKGPVVRELTLAEANELYDIRAVLEGLAARLFIQNANAAQRARLKQALETTERSYDEGDPDTVIRTKTAFYDALIAGAGSESLSTMIASLHGRIRRWRALGLSHPGRSPERSRESIASLHALVAAIEAGDADLAEKISRDEVGQAKAEVTRLLAP